MLIFFQAQIKKFQTHIGYPDIAQEDINPLPLLQLSTFLSLVILCLVIIISYKHYIFKSTLPSCFCFILLKFMMTTRSMVCSSHPRRRRPLLADPLLQGHRDLHVGCTHQSLKNAILTMPKHPLQSAKHERSHGFIHRRYVCV